MRDIKEIIDQAIKQFNLMFSAFKHILYSLDGLHVFTKLTDSELGIAFDAGKRCFKFMTGHAQELVHAAIGFP